MKRKIFSANWIGRATFHSQNCLLIYPIIKFMTQVNLRNNLIQIFFRKRGLQILFSSFLSSFGVFIFFFFISSLVFCSRLFTVGCFWIAWLFKFTFCCWILQEFKFSSIALGCENVLLLLCFCIAILSDSVFFVEVEVLSLFAFGFKEKRTLSIWIWSILC